MSALQSILSKELAQVGLAEEAREVLAISHRWSLMVYGDKAIKAASPEARLDMAMRIKLALDDPADGGPGLARDFEIRKHDHPWKPGTFIYRIYKSTGEPVRLLYECRDVLLKSLVAAYVVRAIVYNDEVVSPWPASPL